MKRSTNEITADGRAPNGLHITTAEEAAACAHVRHVDGQLSVEGVHFDASELIYAGMVSIGWGASAKLPACKSVQNQVRVWGDGVLEIACEGVGEGISCSQSAVLKMPECRSLGNRFGNSINLVQNSCVEAPKLEYVTAAVNVVDRAVLVAPNIAMARARAAMAAAQKLVEEAQRTGQLAAQGPNRPVRMSARLMKTGLDAMAVALGPKTAETKPPTKRLSKALSLEVADPLVNADARPTRRARP